ncbi:MAG TPA: serine protease [Elusimicrobiales bacterium]|nr:serine protease [Elusimicrobiales bacterium]
MKKTLISILALAAFSAGAFAEDKVIYGADDRFDLYQVADQSLLKLADSTVGLFKAADVTIDGATARLNTRSYAQGYSLCKEEPFYDQVNGAFCSGSLVAPDVIMTAGHCVRSESACAGTKFVFGFAVRQAGVMPNSVPAGEVYSCAQLIGREEVGTGADWALIKLDRPVANHAVLKYNTADTLQNGDPLVVIGHPAGLPTKIAGGATVRDASPNGYFVANLDTYGGNSGSAVFNARTRVIEGILVRGANDYVWKGNCRVSNVCASDGCRGEDVTKLSAITATIPSRNLPELALRVDDPDYQVAGNFPAYQLLESLSGLN